MCSRFLGGFTAGSESSKFQAIVCSFQPDNLGFYKNLVVLAQVPATRAHAECPIKSWSQALQIFFNLPSSPHSKRLSCS